MTKVSGTVLPDARRLDALAKGTKGASKWWLPFEQPSVSSAENMWDRPSSAVTPSGRSSSAAQDSDRAHDPDEQPSARSTASRSVMMSKSHAVARHCEWLLPNQFHISLWHIICVSIYNGSSAHSRGALM